MRPLRRVAYVAEGRQTRVMLFFEDSHRAYNFVIDIPRTAMPPEDAVMAAYETEVEEVRRRDMRRLEDAHRYYWEIGGDTPHLQVEHRQREAHLQVERRLYQYEEEQRRWEARRDRWRQEYDEGYRLSVLAARKALDLLKANLTQDQLREFNTKNRFTVIGNCTGTRYWVNNGNTFNIQLPDQRIVMCFGPTGFHQVGDVMLAQKIALETDENAARRVANWSNLF